MGAKKKSRKKGGRRAASKSAAKSVRLTDARGRLTEIVDEAEWLGQATVLTRNGKPVAMIGPIPGQKPGHILCSERSAGGSDGRR